jgi:cytochrome c1
MDALIHDAFPMHTNCDNDDDACTNIKDWDSEAFTNEHNVQQSKKGDNSDKFLKLLKEAEQNCIPVVKSSQNYPSSYTCTT